MWVLLDSQTPRARARTRTRTRTRWSHSSGERRKEKRTVRGLSLVAFFHLDAGVVVASSAVARYEETRRSMGNKRNESNGEDCKTGEEERFGIVCSDRAIVSLEKNLSLCRAE